MENDFINCLQPHAENTAAPCRPRLPPTPQGNRPVPHFALGQGLCAAAPQAARPAGRPGANRSVPLPAPPDHVPGVGSPAASPSGGPARTPSEGGSPGTLMSLPLGTRKGLLCRRPDAVRRARRVGARRDRCRGRTGRTGSGSRRTRGTWPRVRARPQPRLPPRRSPPAPLRGLGADVAVGPRAGGRQVRGARLASLRPTGAREGEERRGEGGGRKALLPVALGGGSFVELGEPAGVVRWDPAQLFNFVSVLRQHRKSKDSMPSPRCGPLKSSVFSFL